MELVWNEDKQYFEAHKEPYAVIEVATEEEYNELIKAVEFYNKYKDTIQDD